MMETVQARCLQRARARGGLAITGSVVARPIGVSEPLVSIVIPAFVSTPVQGRLLDETLETVSAQASIDYEAIVVDDGSPVDVGRIASRHPRTLPIRQPNRGSAAARNAGVERSRGRFMLFLDGDDHLLPGALEVGVGMFAAHPDCGFIVGPREEMTFEGAPVAWDVAPPPPQSEIYTALLGFDWHIIPP